MKQKSKKYLKYISRNNTFLLGKTFLKWLLIGSLIGIFIGGVIAIFLKSLEWATDYRVNHGFVLFLLPIGGALQIPKMKSAGAITVKKDRTSVKV